MWLHAGPELRAARRGFLIYESCVFCVRGRSRAVNRRSGTWARSAKKYPVQSQILAPCQRERERSMDRWQKRGGWRRRNGSTKWREARVLQNICFTFRCSSLFCSGSGRLCGSKATAHFQPALSDIFMCAYLSLKGRRGEGWWKRREGGMRMIRGRWWDRRRMNWCESGSREKPEQSLRWSSSEVILLQGLPLSVSLLFHITLSWSSNLFFFFFFFILQSFLIRRWHKC